MVDTGGPGEVENGSAQLERTMLGVADCFVATIPRAVGAVLALVADGVAGRTVATSALARAADDAQRQLGDGPCLTALAEGRLVTSAALVAGPQWPRFAGRARRLGVHGVLAVPLVQGGTTVALLSLYRQARIAFTEPELSTAEHFAEPAAAIIRNAEVLAQCRAELEQLRAAIQIRPVIDQAIGIIRSHTGESEDGAFERLRTISNVGHVKIAELGRRIVDDAVRDANDRNTSEAAAELSGPGPGIDQIAHLTGLVRRA